MTARPPPKVKKRRQGWSHHICALYDHRWQIEMGFKDLNRITPPLECEKRGEEVYNGNGQVLGV
ncbi:MAG: hypothetical protein ACTSRZ_21335 [Promethearchaeota archaeon]